LVVVSIYDDASACGLLGHFESPKPDVFYFTVIQTAARSVPEFPAKGLLARPAGLP